MDPYCLGPSIDQVRGMQGGQEVFIVLMGKDFFLFGQCFKVGWQYGKSMGNKIGNYRYHHQRYKQVVSQTRLSDQENRRKRRIQGVIHYPGHPGMDEIGDRHMFKTELRTNNGK